MNPRRLHGSAEMGAAQAGPLAVTPTLPLTSCGTSGKSQLKSQCPHLPPDRLWVSNASLWDVLVSWSPETHK